MRRPAFTKRKRIAEPSPDVAGDAPAASEDTAEKPDEKPADVWVPLDVEEVTDTIAGAFDSLEEAFGQEFHLEEKRARKMGARWTKILNRWAERVKSKAALLALSRVLFFFCFLELSALLIGAGIRRFRRARVERAEARKAAIAAGRVVDLDAAREKASGVP